MAAGAIIRFGDDHSLKVQEDVDVVETKLLGAGGSGIPSVHLTRENGDDVLVNAALIRTVSKPADKAASANGK